VVTPTDRDDLHRRALAETAGDDFASVVARESLLALATETDDVEPPTDVERNGPPVRERRDARERKEALIREAEQLAESGEWSATTTRYKELLVAWQAAGRASRGVDDELWARFKAAQDAFFTKRSAFYAAKDAETAAAVAEREALLAEAEAIDPERDPVGARARLADISARWEKTGRVPREVESRLDARLAAVERRVRDAGETRREAERPPPPNPLVVRLRESVEQLEKRAARARAAGDERAAAAADEEAATKREWLTQAERSPTTRPR
jgi:hypothetical protein